MYRFQPKPEPADPQLYGDSDPFLSIHFFSGGLRGGGSGPLRATPLLGPGAAKPIRLNSFLPTMASSMSSSLCFRRSSFGAGHVRLAPSSSTSSVRPSAAPPRHVTTENNVRIRFARHGRKFSPFYRVVVIDSRARREGRPIQYLGWYNPMKKQTSLNAPAIKEWISKGAQPSESVARLLAKASIIELGEFGTYAG